MRANVSKKLAVSIFRRLPQRWSQPAPPRKKDILEAGKAPPKICIYVPFYKMSYPKTGHFISTAITTSKIIKKSVITLRTAVHNFVCISL